VTPAERDVIETAVRDLEAACDGTDHNRIRELTEALDKVTTPLAHRIMDASIQEALQSRRIEEVG